MQEFIRSFNKFTRWKNVKNNNRKYKSNFYRRVLLDKIHNKHQSIEKLREDPTTSMENLSSTTTLFKSIILRISINRSLLKYEKKIIKRHQNKLQSLLNEKNKENIIRINPNLVVTNLSSHVLTNEEQVSYNSD